MLGYRRRRALSRVRRAPGEFETLCLGLTISCLVVPLLVDPVFSLVYRSIFEPSFLLQAVPAGAMVVAFVFGRLLPRPLGYVFTLGLVALLVAGLVPSYGVSYEQWALASHRISVASRPGDCITTNKEVVLSDLGYYFSSSGRIGTAPQPVLPTQTWSEAIDPVFKASVSAGSFQAVAARCGRLWIVLSRASPGQFVLMNGEILWFYRHGYKHLTTSHFVPQYGFGISVALLSR